MAGGDTIVSLTNTITQKRLNAYGALTCSSSTVLSRLRPIGNTITTAVGTPVALAALHIWCAIPNGEVTVTVGPESQQVTLLDNGLGSNQAAGDGIYAAQWAPPAVGTYTLTFSPGGDVITVQVLAPYTVSSVPFAYERIAGSNLGLGDDSAAQITSPFPILFGGGSFTTLFVSSNGNVNVTGPFTGWLNEPIPTSAIPALVAPFWDDLFPIAGSPQNVFWDVTGTEPNRVLVIEWRDLRHYACGNDSSATVKFQVVFFEGKRDIRFNYADTVFGQGCTSFDGGASATIGVQVAPNSGTQWSFNIPSLQDNSSLLWTITPPAIDVTPASQDFGSVAVWSSATRTFTVKNTGMGPLTITVSTSAPFSIVSGGTFSLGPGLSQDVEVSFNPTSEGVFGRSVDFTSTSGDVSRAVTGTGVSSTPWITVVSPNGGESWRINNTKTIQWTSSGVSGNVKIELSRDGGLSWNTLFSSTANDGAEPWKVTKPATTQAKIRVSSVDPPSTSDTSNATFIIK